MTTPVGILNVRPQAIADGPVAVTVRPENLRLGEGGENAIQACIHSHIYVGTHTRFKVEAADLRLEVVADAASVERFQDGDDVPLKFPREKIWLMPPDNAGRGS